jgi:hypothetical protein
MDPLPPHRAPSRQQRRLRGQHAAEVVGARDAASLLRLQHRAQQARPRSHVQVLRAGGREGSLILSLSESDGLHARLARVRDTPLAMRKVMCSASDTLASAFGCLLRLAPTRLQGRTPLTALGMRDATAEHPKLRPAPTSNPSRHTVPHLHGRSPQRPPAASSTQAANQVPQLSQVLKREEGEKRGARPWPPRRECSEVWNRDEAMEALSGR